MPSSKRKSKHISTLGTQVASTISVALVLLILGVLASLHVATGRFAASVLGNVSLVVRVNPATDAEAVSRLGSLLEAAQWSTSVSYLSADDVLRQEMEYNAEALQLIEENPYSAEFEINVAPRYVHADSIAAVTDFIEGFDCVEEVISQTELIKELGNASAKLSLILTLVAAVLLVISVVLIFNTVSIAVYGRRFVIRTMQLVGATSGFIRRPFILSSLLTGFLAAVIASAALVAGQMYVFSLADTLAVPLGWADTAAICFMLLLLGMAICGLSAWVATGKYLRASYDNLYS